LGARRAEPILIPFPPRGLYAITPDGPHPPGFLESSVEDAIEGGAVAIQYRDKSGDGPRRHAAASALCEICRRRQVPLIVNDDVALASAVGASGAHVGRDDTALGAARARLGPDAIIGVSCYGSVEQAVEAARQGADYVAFGRFFPSSTKPGAVPCSREVLEQARDAVSVPVVAIGGITPENGAVLLAAGADVLAVIDGVFGRGDVRAAAAGFSGLFS
jgi:thiamine-phosphate pyrophosphorylase